MDVLVMVVTRIIVIGLLTAAGAKGGNWRRISATHAVAAKSTRPHLVEREFTGHSVMDSGQFGSVEP